MSAALPMRAADRIDAYLRQTGCQTLTPAQRRTVEHKANRAKRQALDTAAGGRTLTPRQSRWARIVAVRAARRRGEAL